MPSDPPRDHYYLVANYCFNASSRDCVWRRKADIRVLAHSAREAKCLTAKQKEWIVVDPDPEGERAYLVRANKLDYLCFARNGSDAKQRVACHTRRYAQVAWSVIEVTTRFDPDQSDHHSCPAQKQTALPASSPHLDDWPPEEVQKVERMLGRIQRAHHPSEAEARVP